MPSAKLFRRAFDMKVGVVADGSAEVAALRELLSRITADGLEIITPLYADMQPLSTPAQIVKAAEGRLPICRGRGCRKIVVLLDHETRNSCPGVWAQTVSRAFHDAGHTDVRVVIKQRQFENWLVADLPTVKRLHGRKYRITDAHVEAVRNRGADKVDAMDILERCTDGEYCKRRDAATFCRAISPDAVAANSRSFRRFLRVVGHPRYALQSRVAAS